ncbi:MULTISPECIES: DUF2269 family protein [unclassified Mesorhizobium]|uniref:DUF2269 family protein n=1 Tax=unclassified Mesorhizobium TaxID=325217 RepID=UPI0003CEF96D|nr:MULTISPECIES: DUF2269 family protein [unclassified Mesorhizobium]ESY50870.1 hypothetical protein X745_25965 [Mesorhizobium sp. LNJC374B00]ESY53496.1 hypothetical protein X744_26545 [Mesorhizobium sp. LNJC372A00]WJI82574.1 DUF2269 domain-containing protein [Mesorhizobium sp. C374B]WJI89096.1 DUF2269 domain-containing protein [Mesorhizobium sp. C372A]
MDWYSLFKFLHVMAAILWLGGGFAMLLVSILADRAGDDETLMVMLRTTDKLGLRLFVPASIATLASGLVLTSLWTGFSDLWVVIGLCGYAAAFLTGILVLKPSFEKLAAMLAADGMTPAAIAFGRRMIRIVKFDFVIMIVVVADMVLKPTAHDIATLGAMAVVVVGGASLTFASAPRTKPAAA